jgi:hypothetical protein
MTREEWQRVRELRLRALADAPDASGPRSSASGHSIVRTGSPGSKGGRGRRTRMFVSERGDRWIGMAVGPLILNDDGSVQAFTTLQQLWQDDLLAPESLQSKYDTDVDYLSGETAWMAQNWPFTSATFADQGILGEFTVYAGWAGPVQPAHVIGGEVLGIPKGVSPGERRVLVRRGRGDQHGGPAGHRGRGPGTVDARRPPRPDRASGAGGRRGVPAIVVTRSMGWGGPTGPPCPSAPAVHRSRASAWPITCSRSGGADAEHRPLPRRKAELALDGFAVAFAPGADRDRGGSQRDRDAVIRQVH